jgi:hypothetical protein
MASMALGGVLCFLLRSSCLSLLSQNMCSATIKAPYLYRRFKLSYSVKALYPCQIMSGEWGIVNDAMLEATTTRSCHVRGYLGQLLQKFSAALSHLQLQGAPRNPLSTIPTRFLTQHRAGLVQIRSTRPRHLNSPTYEARTPLI